MEKEILEYNGVNSKNYHYSLTPVEITESYRNFQQNNRNSDNCHNDTNSINNYSNISSYYSNVPQQNDNVLDVIKNCNLDTGHENVKTQNETTLPKNIAIFKNIFNNINQLRSLFCKLDFLSLIDGNINNIHK